MKFRQCHLHPSASADPFENSTAHRGQSEPDTAKWIPGEAGSEQEAKLHPLNASGLISLLSSAGATPCFGAEVQRHGTQRSVQGDVFQASKCKFLLSNKVGAHARFVLKALGLGGVLTTQTKCRL